jgi:hypothetical protein
MTRIDRINATLTSRDHALDVLARADFFAHRHGIAPSVTLRRYVPPAPKRITIQKDMQQ